MNWRRVGVQRQMITAMVAVIIVAVAATGLPAYALIHAELDRQAWGRVEQGKVSSAALVQAELVRLSDLARLTAERPTLRTLLETGRSVDLEAYLEVYRATADLDRLTVLGARGEYVAGEAVDDLASVPADRAAVIGMEGGVWIIAASPIVDPGDGSRLGTIQTARRLGPEWLIDLKEQTGVDHSLVLVDIRLATTMNGAAGSVRAAAPEGDPMKVGGRPFYSTSLPLGAPDQELSLEVALPVAAIVREEQRALQTLAASTALVAAAVGGLGVVLSRRITRPLDRLTEAAHRISAGDLATPVPVPPGPPEVALLAAALEESRATTQRTLESLRRQKAWLETLLESIVEGIVTLDGHGVITSFSAGAERLTGWAVKEAVGQAAGVVFRTPDGTSFRDQLPRPGGRRALQVLDRRGRVLTLSVTDAPMRPPTEVEAHLALVLRDVSEDEAVRRLRSYFLANISHEFRTPLSAIRASVDLLLEDLAGLSKDEIAELLHSVFLSVTGLQTLIDNLLESLSIEAGRFTIRRVPSDLGAVIDQSAQVMRPLLDRRGQLLEVVIPAPLPPVWMDPMRVTQVIVNLLSNASKYSPVQRPIELRAQAEGHQIVVRVSDRGEGIAPEERENLFRRFVRLEPADPGQYGMGLGLSVVKAIVEEHGGKVGVSDRPGGGSVFWFSLPLRGDLP